MEQMRFRIFCVFTGMVLLIGGCGKQETASVKNIAVTNTYLESAVADLLVSSEKVMQMAGPGMCPGHFDIRPRQVDDLRHCGVLLRFDFQKGLDAKLATVTNDLKIVEVRITGGLGEPDSYLAACRQVGQALSEAHLTTAENVKGRLMEIETRLSSLSSEIRTKMKKSTLAGSPVIASGHQADFCRWLGLKVVAEFSGPDVSRISEIDEAVQKGQATKVKWIMGNEPEGRSVADALAERLGAKVVMLANFPSGGKASFDEMVRDNVDRLRQAEPK